MLRIAHFSDLHYSEQRLEEADRCFGFAVQEAARRGAQVAVVSGDATDHRLDVHSPAVERLARRIRELADQCPVLMLQGTFSHEPPGTLAVFRLLGGRYPVHVADRISQVALTKQGTWRQSPGWRFDVVPDDAVLLASCVPTVNKAAVAAAAGAADAGVVMGREMAALLAGYGPINRCARAAGVPTIGVSHGTVNGCLTEHDVPMAGFDHEFTSGALLAAQTQAFMLGHIHKHQCWDDEGRIVAYAGSIGRFHHGERGDKGFVMWEVGATAAGLELVPTPARRTVDLVFEGLPDMAAIGRAAADQALDGAHVRVRWTAGTESRHQIDIDAIKRALGGAASVQLDGRIVPLVRSRAPGISRRCSLADKVEAWAELTQADPGVLLQRLDMLSHLTPEAIAHGILDASLPSQEKPSRDKHALELDPVQ